LRPSIYEAVLESDSRSLTSTAQLRRLFSFFSDFDASHASTFLLSLASQKCTFRGYFSRLE
jgi:CCR4-NOT transcription complex subunit 1